MSEQNTSQIKGYHAHVYYDPATTKPVAERLVDAIARKFAVRLGGFFDQPVGPHPIANVQIIFTTGDFAELAPWLMLNRGGLDILIHPLTDDSVADHSSQAMWLGNPVPMRLDVLRPQYRRELLPTA